jgi:4-hydroxy-2-oxoglutarate aldolase
MQLRGVFASLPTPFDHLGEVYVPKVRYNIGLLDQTTVSGYLVGGAEGEGALLSRDERVALWKTAADAAGEKLVVPAAGAASVHETLALLTEASQMGFEIALIQTPGGFGPELLDAETQMLFVRSVADGSPIPLIVSPEWSSGEPLQPEVLAVLGRHPRVAALLVVTDDLGYFSSCLAAAQGHADVIVGCASLLAEGLIDGASAAMISFASVVPYLCLSIDEAVRTRELDAARDLQGVAKGAIEQIRKRGIPGLKAAADLKGYYGGVPRLPLAPLPPAAKAEIETALQQIKS